MSRPKIILPFIPQKTLWFLLLALITVQLIPIQGSADPVRKSKIEIDGITVWRWQDRYVKIVRKEPDVPQNDHPVKLTPKQVGVMLGELKVRMPQTGSWFSRDDEANKDVRLLFSDKELAVISDAVSRGLARASANQELAFYTSSNFDIPYGGGIVKERLLNTGRIFFKDGRLNIIFGEVHGEYPETKGAGALVAYEARVPELAWREKEAENHVWNLVKYPEVKFKEGRTDWLLLDERSSMARYEERKRLKKAKDNVPEAIARGTEQIVDDQAALRKKVEELERLIRGMPAQPGEQTLDNTPAPAPAPAAPANSVVEMERRLEILKNLKDQGLIPEDVYNQQVQEILNEGF